MKNTYVVRRGQRYYFRMRVPAGFVASMGCDEIVKSLGTRYHADAKVRAARLAKKTTDLYTAIGLGMLTEKQIADLVARYKCEVLDGLQKHRERGSDPMEAAGSGDLRPMSLQDGWLSIMNMFDPHRTLEDVNASIALNQRMIAQRRESLQLSRIDDDARWTTFRLAREAGHHEILPTKGYLHPDLNAYFDRPSPEFNELARAVVRTEIEVLDTEIQRLQGYDTDWDRAQRIQRQKPIIKLSAVCDLRLDELKQKGRAVKTIGAAEVTHAFLIRLLGDKDVKDYTRDDILRASNYIRLWPKNANVTRGTKEISPDEIIARTDLGKPYSSRKVDWTLTYINSVFNYAKDAGYIDRSPCPKWENATKLTLSADSTDEKRHKPWSPAEIRRLIDTPYFTSRRYRVQEPEQFWIPMIALFSGMRQSEICQLWCDDLKEDNGIHYIAINRNPARKQSTKNLQSVRKVPIHSTLLALGLLDYRDSIAAKFERLFPTLKHDKKAGNWSTLYSKRFAKYIGRLMTWDDPAEKRVYHGLRSTFMRTLRDMNGLPMERMSYLTGHAAQQKMAAHYAGTPQLQLLSSFMEQLDYGLDFVGLLLVPTRK